MNALPILSFVLFGYLLGSLPFAVMVSKAFGLADPRSFGSGNPGATNVLRTGNKTAAAVTLLGDILKGWLAVFLARALGADDTGVAAAGLAAFCGHLFPVFLRFRGGKGVATALGVLAGFSGFLALATAAVWLAMAAAFRYSSLASLTAAAAAVPASWLLLGHPQTAAAAAVMVMLLTWRHRANIRRLLAGTESRIGAKKAG